MQDLGGNIIYLFIRKIFVSIIIKLGIKKDFRDLDSKNILGALGRQINI